MHRNNIPKRHILETIDHSILIRAIEQSPASIVITDTDGAIQYVNPKFEAITGYSFEEVKGKNPRILKSGFQDTAFYQNMWNTILRGEVWDGIFHNKRKDGTFFWEHCVIAPVTDDSGKVTHFVAIKEDITEKKEQEEALQRSEEELRRRNEIIQKDLEYARRVQNSIIHSKIPDFPDIIITTRYIPYDYVGGDFFSIKKISDKLCIFMADITGHGVPAALFSTMLKYAVENLWNNGVIKPDDVMLKLNEQLIDILRGYYFTAFYGVITIDSEGQKTITYSRCGHPYPILFSNGEITFLDARGTLLGVYKDITVDYNTINLRKDDRLIIYTDGLIEIGIGDEKGLHFDILASAIQSTKHLPLEKAIDDILSIVTSNRQLDDDVAIIALEIQ